MIGSIVAGKGDRWSDLDVTFGVEDEAKASDVLADWTARLKHEFNAVSLFDVSYLSSVYRVFLLPSNLQEDLSFTPRAEFGAYGPEFSLLWGSAVERPRAPAPSADHFFGLAVHHLVRARICIERVRF